MDFLIQHWHNPQSSKPHCFDIYDDTGYCVKICRSKNAEESEAEARAWVAEQSNKALPCWLDKLDEPWRSMALADLQKAGVV